MPERHHHSDKPELEAVLYAIGEHLEYLRVLLILDELRVKLEEALGPDEPEQRELF